MMTGNKLREWRKRQGLTQEALRQALGIGSRQTLIKMERSDGAVPRMVELSIMALEHLPETVTVAGIRMAAWEHKEQRKRAPERIS